MKFLVDTNIILSLGPDGEEDLGVHPYSAACFHRLARKNNCSLFVHPLSLDEVDLRCQGERAAQVKEQMATYDLIDGPIALSVFEQNQVIGFPKKGSSDYLENAFLAAIKTDVVDFLVTERITLHMRAGSLGLSTRVLFLSDALGLLKDLFETSVSARPMVEKIPFSLIDLQDPVFWTMSGLDRKEGDDDDALKLLLTKLKAKQLEAFVIKDGDKSRIAGICVVEQRPGGHKIQLFFVAPPYPMSRYGALLLKSVCDNAIAHGDGQINFSGFPGCKKFVTLVQSLGFKGTGPILTQVMTFRKNKIWVLPLLPLAHEALFPELESQLSLFPYSGPQGNVLEKVCSFDGGVPGLSPGDTLLIYRTQGPSAITAMGVIQDTLVASSPNGVVRFIGSKTVWNYDEIVDLCKKKNLVIKFRRVKILDDSLRLHVLKEQGVLKGRPRKIVKVKGTGIGWLKKTLKIAYPV